MNNYLHQFGWLHYGTLQSNNIEEDHIGRIQAVHKTNYIVITHKGPLVGELTGQMLYTTSTEERPQTGDWVEIMLYDTQCIITRILPRYSVLARKEAGKKSDKQLFAANIDKAIIVQGLDRDYNPRRLERMVTALKDAAIEPIILLNKSDLASDLEDKKLLIERNLPGTTIHCISALIGDGIERVEQLLQAFNTYILIGSSGAGKSTLLNALTGGDTQKTGEISSAVGKGKHTTSTRELFALPNGSLIIDTAGIREFGLALDNPESVASTFTDIDQLTSDCYYDDCTHTEEPGCAILKAIDNKELDPEIYNSYLKLRSEAEHYQATQKEKKRKGKDLSKLVRNMKRYNIKKRY